MFGHKILNELTSKSINVQARQVQQNYNANSQVFWEIKNIFAPNGIKTDNTSEPMSSSSSVPKPQLPRPNNFPPSGPP